MESNSSEESTASDYSTDSSDEDGMETAQINGTKLQLPQGLCEKEDIFKEFFSPHVWNSLSEQNKLHLRTFLPKYPDNDETEKSLTLQKLFSFETFKFNSPLQMFHEHLKAGYFRPDIAKMRKMIQKAERKEAKHRYKSYRERLKNEVIESQRKLLYQIKNLPPGREPRVKKINSSESDIVRHRTKRRYFQILASIRSKTEDVYSSDENYIESAPISLSRKQKRHLNSVKNSLLNSSEKFFISTLATKSNSIDLERYVTPHSNPFYVNDESYKNLVTKHKKRKLEETDDPEFCTKGIILTDVIQRTQLPYIKLMQIQPNRHHTDHKSASKKKIKKEVSYNIHHQVQPVGVVAGLSNHQSSNTDIDTDSDSIIDAVTVPPKDKRPEIKPTKPSVKVQSVKPKIEIKKEPEEIVPIPIVQTTVNSNTNLIKPISNYSQYGKIMPVTISDLEGIDMMNIPIDLNNSDIDILELNNKPELMQETHSNFLSLIRDIICSTNEHRMNLSTLQKRLQTWQESPISPLNDWYSLSDDWVGLLSSAIDFLSGNSMEQPDDFVPYMEYKTNLDMYQWIGAGRDSDILLSPLCKYWLEHRTETKTVKDKDEVDIEISDRAQTPLPPRCPTNWTIRKATPEEVTDFREQEKCRYNNPHKAFTYCCNGFESVVGPLKGIYNPAVGNSKARGHTMLTADRPNFVTILSLVRDATARLPNGEGTRADIVELLKCSQYIAPKATDSVLQTVVSGALDRMHTQFDPCVKYDPKRKIWIYLHRNRTEEDFEKIHQHLQGMNKQIKKTTKKSPAKPKVKQTPEKIKIVKETQPSVTVDKQKAIRKPNQQVSIGVPTSLLSPSSKTTSLLLSNNLQKSDTSPPKTIKILENIQTSPQAKSQTPEEKEVNEALHNLVDNRISSPKLSKPSKSLVKILSPSQGKSLIIPPNSTFIKQELNAPSKQLNPQVVSQHLLQNIAAQKQAIQIIHKQSPDDCDRIIEQKIKVPITLQQQIIQSITPHQLQNIKNVTLLRNVSQHQTVGLTSSTINVSAQSSDIQNVTVTVAKSNPQEQMIQSGIQIKTPNNLTPAQQQQILQSIKQKILPQTVLTAHQQQILLKQKALSQAQKLNQASSGISLLGQSKLNTDNLVSKSTMVPSQTPLVAKVFTNAAGQVISVESLLAHQKQHGSLPQGTLRVTGTKGGQPNIVQLTATSKQNAITQFAVTSQNNIIAITTQPKLVVQTQTSTVTSTVTCSKPIARTIGRAQATAKFPPKVTQQLINAKLLQSVDGQKIVQPKLIMGQQGQVKLANTKTVPLQKPILSVAGNSGSIRMVNTANLNLTHIGGKPVLLASKGSTIQNIQGQNVILQTTPNASHPSLVLQNAVKTVPATGMGAGSTGNINIINQQNVMLGSQIKVQQPQVVFKNNNVAQVSQGHIVLGGHPVRLQSSNTNSTQRLVLASQGQGGQIVAQQILLPAGFQGTAINIKALQGVKVIPLAQAHGQARGIQSRQVFARVVNPNISKQCTTVNIDKNEETNSNEDL